MLNTCYQRWHQHKLKNSFIVTEWKMYSFLWHSSEMGRFLSNTQGITQNTITANILTCWLLVSYGQERELGHRTACIFAKVTT